MKELFTITLLSAFAVFSAIPGAHAGTSSELYIVEANKPDIALGILTLTDQVGLYEGNALLITKPYSMLHTVITPNLGDVTEVYAPTNHTTISLDNGPATVDTEYGSASGDFCFQWGKPYMIKASIDITTMKATFTKTATYEEQICGLTDFSVTTNGNNASISVKMPSKSYYVNIDNPEDIAGENELTGDLNKYKLYFYCDGNPCMKAERVFTPGETITYTKQDLASGDHTFYALLQHDEGYVYMPIWKDISRTEDVTVTIEENAPFPASLSVYGTDNTLLATLNAENEGIYSGEISLSDFNALNIVIKDGDNTYGPTQTEDVMLAENNVETPVSIGNDYTWSVSGFLGKVNVEIDLINSKAKFNCGETYDFKPADALISTDTAYVEKTLKLKLSLPTQGYVTDSANNTIKTDTSIPQDADITIIWKANGKELETTIATAGETKELNIDDAVNGTTYTAYITLTVYGKDYIVPCNDFKLVTASISDVNNHVNSIYYDLNGRRTSNPSDGLLIRISGNKAQKVMK